MPKTAPNPHFDVEALLSEVHKQDFGLHISTNNPGGFRRICYSAMRAKPSLRCHIYASPLSKRRFTLLRSRLESTTATPLEEQDNGTAEG